LPGALRSAATRVAPTSMLFAETRRRVTCRAFYRRALPHAATPAEAESLPCRPTTPDRRQKIQKRLFRNSQSSAHRHHAANSTDATTVISSTIPSVRYRWLQPQ
jgi:hypothetical protein